MAGTYEDRIKTGAIVEVSSNEEGLRGSWYSATVIRPCSPRNTKIFLEYHHLMTTKSGKKQLREHVDAILVRPAPPREPPCSVRFKVDDDIDAFHNDGWWEGVVIEVLEGERYSVFFRCSREQIQFHASELRVHREWVNGDWVPPLEPISPLQFQLSSLKPENGNAIETKSKKSSSPLISRKGMTNSGSGKPKRKR